jgi:hypothetical protein
MKTSCSQKRRRKCGMPMQTTKTSANQSTAAPRPERISISVTIEPEWTASMQSSALPRDATDLTGWDYEWQAESGAMVKAKRILYRKYCPWLDRDI